MGIQKARGLDSTSGGIPGECNGRRMPPIVWFFAFQEPSAGVGYMQRSIDLEPIEHIFGDFPRLTFPYPEERESSEPPRSHYGRQGGKQKQERFKKKPLISCRRLSQSCLF